jgi:hypothetical protein
MKNTVKHKVKKAIEIFENATSQLSEKELYILFMESEFFENEEYYYLVFIPLIVTKLAYPEVQFSEMYYENINGVIKQGFFMDNILYNNIYKELLNITEKEGISGNLVLKIVGRSGEFQLLNDVLLKKNLNLSDLKMLPITLNKW